MSSQNLRPIRDYHTRPSCRCFLMSVRSLRHKGFWGLGALNPTTNLSASSSEPCKLPASSLQTPCKLTGGKSGPGDSQCLCQPPSTSDPLGGPASPPQAPCLRPGPHQGRRDGDSQGRCLRRRRIGAAKLGMINSGATPCIVAKVLTDLGYPTARYAKRWSDAGVKNALSRFCRIVGVSMPSLTGPSISD